MARKTNAGGKRVGAGRPSGSNLPVVVPPVDIDGLELSPAQRTYASYRALGLSISECTRRMEFSRQTLSKWENSNWMRIACETARQKLLGNPHAIFAPMIGLAEQVYYDTMIQEDDIPSRIRTARNVMEMLYGKAVVREHIQTVSDVNITVVIRENKIEDYIDTPGIRVLDGT